MALSDTETLDRRRLLTLVGGTALTLPLAGCASPGEGEEGEEGEGAEGGEDDEGAEGGEDGGGEGGEGEEGEDEEESLDSDAVVVTGPEQSS